MGRKITLVSGGQTGADRAALDPAIELGLEHAGWCPRGRLAEDGVIPEKYQLKETPTSRYPQRTEWNVRDSDGTAIFTLRLASMEGGTFKTLQLVQKRRKPVIHICKQTSVAPEEELRGFIEKCDISLLNVAGPRGSKEEGIGAFVKSVLIRTLKAST